MGGLAAGKAQGTGRAAAAEGQGGEPGRGPAPTRGPYRSQIMPMQMREKTAPMTAQVPE